MPRIFDSIEQSLLPALKETLGLADRADFCLGYFNLWGWKEIGSYSEPWPGGRRTRCSDLSLQRGREAQSEALPR